MRTEKLFVRKATLAVREPKLLVSDTRSDNCPHRRKPPQCCDDVPRAHSSVNSGTPTTYLSHGLSRNR